MDFLLLLSHRARLVIEVDGRSHYADDNGCAEPGRYAAMMAEDRVLTLSGYEVYRFGAEEFAAPDAKETIAAFFDELLARYRSAVPVADR